MATKLVTPNLRLHSIRQITESVNESANTSYYLFVGNHTDDLSNTDLDLAENTTYHSVYNNMIMGKRFSSSDVVELVRNIPYTSNTIYAMYDHTDKLLYDKQFFVVVDEGSYKHIYKCLDNNRNNYSTVQPDFSHISGANTEIYRTSDGYVWKYMYSYSSAQALKFETSEYSPVVPNTTVTQSATPGRIDVIQVETTGRKYDTYIVGTLSNFDLAIGGNSQIYQISNTTAKNSNGFYTDCLMYISAGTGAGGYKSVIDYYSNTTGKYVVLDSEFTIKPTNASEYQIYPAVKIKGGQDVTINAVARALVNALASNGVYRVEMLNSGAGYTYYAEASVLANAAVGVQAESSLKVILSPINGHGSDPGRELYSNAVQFSLKLSNTESNTILTSGQFSQIGILKDPTFSGVSVQFANVEGTFLNGETVYKIEPQYLLSANTTLNSNQISVSLDQYLNNIKVNDMLYLHYTNENFHQLSNVASVNSTVLQLTTNTVATANTVKVYKANESSNGVVEVSNSTYVNFDTYLGTVSSNNLLVGWRSGAKAISNTIYINGEPKGFATFISMPHAVGDVNTGIFLANEPIYQTTINNSNAIVHSITTGTEGTRLFYTNQKEKFYVGAGTLKGQTSGASFNIESLKQSEIKFGSGEVLFIENVNPVTRTANTTETFQIIFEF